MTVGPTSPGAQDNPSTHPSTEMEREYHRTLGAADWESARIEELSQEIRKLLGNSTHKENQRLSDTVPADVADRKPGTGATKGDKLAETADALGGSDKQQPQSDLPQETRDTTEPASIQQRWSTSRMPAMPESDSVLDGLDLSQPLNLYRVPDGIMQVFIMGIHPSNPVNRPYVVVRLGDQVFQTSVGKVSTGNWNEGFELIVSYHMQLFGTVHMDVYSSNTLLPDTLIGRAEIRISLLDGFPEIFTSYYEIWDKKLAASTVPDQRQRFVVSKNLGALQVRINYRFQKLEDPESKAAKVHGAHIAGTVPSQLVNQMANLEDPSSSVDMPIEDIVAGFANEYNCYMDMVHTTELWPHLQSPRADSSGKEGSVGFAKVDDDGNSAGSNVQAASTSASAAPTSANEAGDKGTSGSSIGSFGWFSDLFSSSAPTAGTTGDKDTTEVPSAATPRPSTTAERKGPTALSSTTTPTEKTLMQSLTSMFISPSTFMAIKSLDRLVSAFNQGVELSNTELLGGLLTLYKYYTEAEIPSVTRPPKGELVQSVRDLEVPGHYARFALASYGWRALYFFNRGITLMDGAKFDSDVTSVLQYLNLAQEDLLGYEFRSSQLFCPSYFVAHDRKYNAVVLAVRGTMSAEDTVVDLSCEYTKWNGGLVHSGMKASAHWLFVKVMPLILAYAKSHKLKTIRIVGHSLGGSTAAILMIMIQSAQSRLEGLGIDVKEYDIKTYCYGPAPCISDNIAERFRDCIETYVNNDDLVPRLSYGAVSDFKRMAISAADESDNLTQRLYAPFEDSNLQQQRWKERFARLMKIREDIIAAQENLHLALPGVVHHMVAYRGATSKGKKELRNHDLEIAIGRRQLFGSEGVSATAAAMGANVSAAVSKAGFVDIDNAAADGAGLDAEASAGLGEGELKRVRTKTVQPPPTPAVKVRSDSVDPQELAEAINTSISNESLIKSNTQTAKPSASGSVSDKGTASAAYMAANSATASDKFYPVWVQTVAPDSFRELILRPTIITDHMPSAYESAFARAIETRIREKRLQEGRKNAEDKHSY
ncbi:hypothetical protein GGI07_002214 [Coemansia sp. Benny D115]|nr:hypothetical protein GGI07_002214 [Coemansia sp. Benny D115]